ncbi:class I SAM-dependent methyltransferase [Candidatus Uhrbacteria bacterium]|nr:class I SAM-dependent methyltransferase [Candidatus Uhrbacteria bacterium]
MNPETAKQILQLTQDGYVRIARYFDKTRNTVWEDFSIFRPSVKEGARVLDVGCGNGRLYAALKDKHITYVGVDQNPYLIEQAQERYPDARFFVGNILSLQSLPEVSGERFDIVFSVAVVCHLPSVQLRRHLIASARSLLVRDGLLMMLNWNLWRFARRHKSIWKNLHQRLTLSPLIWREMYVVSERDMGFRDVMTWWGTRKNGVPLYYRAFSAGELRALCRDVGFGDISSFYTAHGRKAHWWNGRNLALIARNTLVSSPVRAKKKAPAVLRQMSYASAPKIIRDTYAAHEHHFPQQNSPR